MASIEPETNIALLDRSAVYLQNHPEDQVVPADPVAQAATSMQLVCPSRFISDAERAYGPYRRDDRLPVSVKLAATVGRTSVIGQVAEAIATRDMEKLGCIAILGLGTRGPGRLSRVRPSDPISAGVRDLEPSDGITIRLPTSIEQLVVALKDLATKANQVRENGHLLPANQRELDHMLLTAIDTIRSCFEHGFRIEPGTSKVVRQRVDFVTTKNGIMDIEDVPNLLEDVPIFLRGLERGNPKAAEELLKHAMETVQANFRKAFF